MDSEAPADKETTGGIVRYRLKAPDLFTPPREHNRLAEREYEGPYQPYMEQLETFGVIEVRDWGEDR